MKRTLAGIGTFLTLLAVAGCTSAGGDNGSVSGSGGGPATSGADGTASTPAPSPAGPPKLVVERVAGGIEHGWDLGFLPDGKVLITERPGRLTLLDKSTPGATVSRVEADFGDVQARGEGGLMGMVVHPDFATSHQFTTCQTHWDSDDNGDVRLITWELSDDGRSARRVRDPLVGGLPVNPSGRHSGCRPIFAPDGSLLVGTGDTARGRFPQDRTNLGGKVLRIDVKTGGPAAGNPFERSGNANERLIWTFGHRNVQGIAIQPRTGEAYTAEHGPNVDDEVNRLQAGANYGWDPSKGGTVGGYDERVPMTDKERFPDAVAAVWSSGAETEAICGMAFLSGSEWGSFEGVLAVTALKGSKVLFLTLGPDGVVSSVAAPPELDGQFGRLRAARLGPDGALYVTTSNGDDDSLLRVAPS
jgi:aldose sugar dehydrogenase